MYRSIYKTALLEVSKSMSKKRSDRPSIILKNFYIDRAKNYSVKAEIVDR